jgi:hypothetical protein
METSTFAPPGPDFRDCSLLVLALCVSENHPTVAVHVSTKDRAYGALLGGLIARLPAQRAELIDDTGRTASFEDNLLSTLSDTQVSELRKQLSDGDGGELDYAADGTRPDAYAAHSSSALAFNAFGAWLGYERSLIIDGVSGFTDQLRVEARQRIFRGGRAPNLDCLVTGPDVVAGIESKLTEPLARHHFKPWSDAYGRESCRALLEGGWLKTLDAARAGSYRPVHLDAGQLVKHALGLNKQHPTRERHLAYVYWEPADGGEFEEVRDHRTEVGELLERVGNANPRLHAVTYAELWRQWGILVDVRWLPAHLAALRGRYAVPIAAGRDLHRKRAPT